MLFFVLNTLPPGVVAYFLFEAAFRWVLIFIFWSKQLSAGCCYSFSCPLKFPPLYLLLSNLFLKLPPGSVSFFLFEALSSHLFLRCYNFGFPLPTPILSLLTFNDPFFLSLIPRFAISSFLCFLSYPITSLLITYHKQNEKETVPLNTS